MPTPERLRRLRSVLERRQDDIEVILDNIHDSHNASAILRTCDGFGVGTVNLLYTDHEFPEISEGVSGFTRKWMVFHRFADPAVCAQELRRRCRRIYATSLDPGARNYLEVNWAQPAAIAFGNEHRGCTEALLELADERIFIPMQGMARSFNVSVSAGIILAEVSRQRLAAGLSPSSWSADKERLYHAWVARERPGD